MKPEKNQQSKAVEEIETLLKASELQRKETRINNGVRDLLHGNIQILNNREFCEGVTDRYSFPLPVEQLEEGFTLLSVLGEGGCSEEQLIRERAMLIISKFINQIIERAAHEHLPVFSGLLANWLQHENELINGYDYLCNQIAQVVGLLLESGDWPEAGFLLGVISEIVEDTSRENNSLVKIVTRLQAKVLTEETKEHLVSLLNNSKKEEKDEIEALILSTGPKLLSHILLKLKETAVRRERFCYVQLLGKAGKNVLPLLKGELQQHHDWFYVRNMVMIAARVNDSRFYQDIAHLVSSEDSRVQHELVKTIIKFDGSEITQRLIYALEHVHNRVKVVIVRKLAGYENPEIIPALQGTLESLLESRKHVSIELLTVLITALTKKPDQKSLQLIESIPDQLPEVLSDHRVVHLIKTSLSIIVPQVRHAAHRYDKYQDQVEYMNDPVSSKSQKEITKEVEKKIRRLQAAGEIDKISQLLLAECTRAMAADEQETAEYFQARILETNPNDLQTFLDAGEIITGKQQPVNNVDIWEGWKDLEKLLGSECCTALHEASDLERYQGGELIALVGERDERLYYIGNGTVDLHCEVGGNETFLKRLGVGEFFGAVQFFAISRWTITVKARSDVYLHALERGDLDSLEEKWPGLKKTLHSYCMKKNTIPDLLKMSNTERRETVRYPVSAAIRVSFEELYGATTQKTIYGKTNDISQGGMSFEIGLGGRLHPTMLMAKQVRIEMVFKHGITNSYDSVIVAITSPKAKKEKYLIHVKFLHQLPSAVVKDFALSNQG